jgi:integrase
VHFEADHGDELLSSWTRARAREWLSRMCGKLSSNPTHKNRTRPIAAGTVTNTLNLIRRAFQDAIDDGVIEGPNPFQSLRVRKSRHATTREKWTVLTLDEQQRAILVLGDLPERLLVQFAMGSGLRQSEQWSLRLADVHLDGPTPYVLVRFGGVLAKPSRLQPFAEKLDGAWFLPTKGGRPRKVPLFGIALAALRQWLVQLKKYAPKNPHRLVFPRADGAPRRKGRAFRAFSRISATAGRSVRWHDLRHTCASALVGGWWGPPWSLEEVRVFLGHASITQTERYAHFAPDRLNRVAERTLDFTEASGQGVSNGEECSDAPSRPAGHSAPDNCPRRVRRTDAGRSSVDPALLQGVQTMVDDRECEELENVEPAPESADEGRFSSEVEQRFRNPETGSETSQTEAGAPSDAASTVGDTAERSGGADASDEPPGPSILEQGTRISSALLACHTERDALKLERDELHQRIAAREARIVSLEAALSDRRDELTLARGALELRERESAAHRKIIAKQSAEIDRLRGESDEWRAAYARACASAVGRLSDPSFASSSPAWTLVALERAAQLDERAREWAAKYPGEENPPDWAATALRALVHDMGDPQASAFATAKAIDRVTKGANPSPASSSSPHAHWFKSAEERDAAARLYWQAREWANHQGLTKELLAAAMRLADAAKGTPHANPSPASSSSVKDSVSLVRADAGAYARRVLAEWAPGDSDEEVDACEFENFHGWQHRRFLVDAFCAGAASRWFANPSPALASFVGLRMPDEASRLAAIELCSHAVEYAETGADDASFKLRAAAIGYWKAVRKAGVRASTTDAGKHCAGCDVRHPAFDCPAFLRGEPQQTSEAGLFSRGQTPSPIRSSGEGSAPINLCPSEAKAPSPTCGWCKGNPIGDCMICQARPSTPETYADDRPSEACPLHGAECLGVAECLEHQRLRSETAKDPDVDERAPDMATAAAAVAERDALPFGERATRDELPGDDDEDEDVPGPYRAVAQAERARRRQESPRIAPAVTLETRHRRAVGLLSDAVKALHAAEAFLNEEVKR